MIEIRKGQAGASSSRQAFGGRYRAGNHGTWPGELSKTWRLSEIAQQVVQTPMSTPPRWL